MPGAQSSVVGNRWEPRLGYFYQMPLPTPPFDISVTPQSSFTEFFRDTLMGNERPKGVYIQIFKGMGEESKAERGGENHNSKHVQATIWSPDYVKCIHSLFECLLCIRH